MAGTVATTTFQSVSTYGTGQEQVPYKSTMAARNILVNRPAGVSMNSSGSKRMANMGIMELSIPQGAYTTVANTGVKAVRISREQEKKDIQGLNERFASYIEKVRFLEAQNRRLADELDKLKAKWGKETSSIKAMYQSELDEARRLLDDAEQEKARLEIRCASLDEQIEQLRAELDELKQLRIIDRETIERQNQQLSDYEAEINLLRRRIEIMEADRERDRRDIARLNEALNRVRVDLDNETLNHIDAEDRRQTLEEELEFLKQVHEQEMKELATLAYRDTTSENRDFWKNEMGIALREIQLMYDQKLEAMRGEIETFYNLKMQEFRAAAVRQDQETARAKEDAKKLRLMLTDLRSKLADMEARNAQLEKKLEMLQREHQERRLEWEATNNELKEEIAKLRSEMDNVLKEIQDLMDTKLGLELEIAAYRKLLDTEETRIFTIEDA